MSHPLQDTLIQFVSGGADEALAERIFSHLAECPPCADRVRAIAGLRRDFEGSWNTFLEEAYRRRASEDTTAVAGISLVLRGILDGSRRLAALAWDRMGGALLPEGGLQLALSPAYYGVGDPQANQAARSLVEEASRLLEEGDEAAALTSLEAAARADAGATVAANLDISVAGRFAGRIVTDAARRSISVVLYPAQLGTVPREARIRFPGSPQAASRRASFSQVAGATYVLAEFHDVPDGPFVLELQAG